MRKITDFIIEKRKPILVIFLVFALISVFLMQKVNVNYDITKYLPSTSETRIGMDIMEDNFEGEDESSLYVMFSDLKTNEKQSIKKDLEKIKNVKEVDYDIESKDYNKGKYTLYIITVDGDADSKEATSVYNRVTKDYKDYDIETSGDVSERNKPVLPTYIVALAVLCALVILIVMCNSYVEPFLFLFVILLAVLLNNGTNAIFSSVSNITNSISAILQMALSMDYSIMLMNRYNQEKQKEKDNVKAMKNALHQSFKSISSSSVTTIVGLLALVFMSFTIGKDLGLVLAKGVLLSLLCIFTCLPGLILMFDKWIVKTKKKTFNIKLDKLGKISYKMRYIAPILFIGIFITSYSLKGNLNIEYTSNEEDEINKVFKENNQIAIVYKNKYEDDVSNYCKSLEDNKKVDSVLCYGNTINEELTYDKLNDRLNSLGSSAQIDDELLKIIYYDYYNKDNTNKMTFSEFTSFVKNKMNDSSQIKLDSETKNNIDKLDYFTTVESVNKKRTKSELASIFGIDEEDVNDLLIYYNSKNNNAKLSINEFVNFMNNDVLTNNKYKSSIPSTARSSLKTVEKFINKNTINSKLSKKEMADLFNMDEEVLEQLYIYYYSIYGTNIKLSINEFSNFVLNNESTSKLLDSDSLNSIKLLSTLSNKEIINKSLSSSELSNIFNIDEDIVKQVMLLDYVTKDNNSKLTLSEFILYTYELKTNTHYLDDVDVSSLTNLKPLATNENNINNVNLNKAGLSKVFNSNIVNMVYSYLGLNDNYEMTTSSFVDMVLNSNLLDEENTNNFKLLKVIINDSVSANPASYTSYELSQIIGIDKSKLNQIYTLIDYKRGNTSSWVMSPYNFINIILENKTNENVSKNLNTDTLNTINLAKLIMDSSINNTTYSYSELSNIIGIDESLVKSIYSLYSKNSQKISPIDFTSFIINHSKDSALNGKISNENLNQLKLIYNIMNGVNEDKKYSSKELSNLLGLNKEDLDLLYSLYSSLYINQNQTISIKEFTNFLVNDVLNNSKYNSNFDDKSKTNLYVINEIIDGTINNKKYSSMEMSVMLNTFSDDLDSNLIDLVYLYYSSENYYNDNWTLTIEKFVNYLNDNILKDNRLKDFIDKDTKKTIIDFKKEINDSKTLLVGDDYSRIIINTKLDPEGKETYKFIKKIKDELIKNKNGIYVIGDSPMAYEMNETFNDELNYITILTMIFIFIVVAVTFKSLIIPFVLVFIIQCAVYLTMGILSLLGGNVYFIALLIVQSILMGATIDYAILYTSYYLESRSTMDVKKSLINAYNKSIHTILTSSSILIIVTLIIGNFTSAVAAKICKTLSQGTLCSALLILLLLPAILAALDKFIYKKEK